MNGEIICVGTELLLGDIVNTNARFLAEELAGLGINVYSQTVVGDNEKRIKQAVFESLKHNRVIILTGGLGPTEDDLTKESVASLFSLPLIEDVESRRRIEEYFRRTARTATDSNFKQALIPKGAAVLKNDIGTAPGCIIENGESTVIILPGPPEEMKHMFLKYAKPALAKLTNNTIISHSIRITGEMESAIEEKLGRFTKLKNPTVATYAKEGEVRIRVTASAQTADAADNLCKPIINEIKHTVGDSVYGTDCEPLQHVVVELLKSKKLKIATAESCTAGLLSSLITEVAGSSSVFDFGISAYANRIKTAALGVPESIIEKYGAVSEHTAAYMAMGARKVSNADIGVGITGVAGPGASENKPVGLVYIAVADRENIWVRRTTLGHGTDERKKIRRNSANIALDLVRRYLLSLPETMPGGFKIGSVPTVLTAQPQIAGPAHIEPTAVSTAIPAPARKVHNGGNFIPDEAIAQLIQTVADSDYSEERYVPTENENDSQFIAEHFDRDDLKLSLYDRIFTDRNKVYIDNGGLVTEKGGENEKEEKNDSKFILFLRSFLPWAGDSKGDIIRKLLFTISLIALIISSTYMICYFREGHKQNSVIETARESYSAGNLQKNSDGTYESFDELLEQNKYTVGWITVPGTNIDNPIVKYTDNDYYLRRNFFNEKSRYGTLFFDADAVITKSTVSKNLVLYGHNMKDGAMFGQLKNYKNVNFYKENPTFNLRTLYSNANYKIFAIMITGATPDSGNGYIFDYRRHDFQSSDEFSKWIAQAKQRSIINTGVEVEEDDTIVTLSTCSYDFDDARLVIMARKVRNDENSSIDKSAVSVNASPLYPQAYYDKKGLENPYKNLSSTSQTSSEESSSDTYSDSDISSNSSILSSSDKSLSDNSSSSSSKVSSSQIGGSAQSNISSAVSEESSSDDKIHSSDTSSTNTDSRQ